MLSNITIVRSNLKKIMHKVSKYRTNQRNLEMIFPVQATLVGLQNDK
jgi:hypothetical protein